MPPTRSIEVLPTAVDLFHAAAEEFVRAARTAIGAQGRFTVALSGGSTPKALYSLLASNYARLRLEPRLSIFRRRTPRPAHRSRKQLPDGE